jgi:small subunit ribosomal protein S3
MGQKINAVGFRIGVNRGWESNWFAQERLPHFLCEDIAIRRYLEPAA